MLQLLGAELVDLGLERRLVGAELLARKDEVGRMLSREEGKPLANGIAETIRAAQIFKFFAQEALRLEGVAIASVRPGVDVTLTREPLGVVGLIAPWNFPIAIPAWKIAPALCFGQRGRLQARRSGARHGLALGRDRLRAGLPKGVFNLVMGRGSVVGQTLI
ncbi:MAG: aldehyde dehydrogenase family protein, partial [Rhodospirillaceae bacterium]|nr:aldehyde dehydrogenase family protein [Rhodospirillaceae bacterium]